jgi:modulator of FtsH protease
MAVMGCVAYLFQINCRRIAGIGFAALLALMLLGIFTLLTVGDFGRIRAGGDGQSAVSLSLSVYLDAINIFLAELQLTSGRRKD